MTKARVDVDHWIAGVFERPQPSRPQALSLEITPTAVETKANQTTRVAREIIEADKDQRQADRARLQQARLEREAQGRGSQGSSASEKQQPGEAD